MQTRVAPARIAVEYSRAASPGSARVVSSVTYITGSPSPTAKRDRLLGQLQQLVERPAFGVLPERARADERAALDRHAGALRDLGDRLDVGDRPSARRSSAVTVSRASTISRASRSTSRTTCGPGAGQADVGGLDAESVDQVQDAQLLVDRRAADRRRLQAVAQRLVVQHARAAAGAARTPFQSWMSGCMDARGRSGSGPEIRSADRIEGRRIPDQDRRIRRLSAWTNEPNRHEADEEHDELPTAMPTPVARTTVVCIRAASGTTGPAPASLSAVPEQVFLDAARHEHVVDAVADDDREQRRQSAERESLRAACDGISRIPAAPSR